MARSGKASRTGSGTAGAGRRTVAAVVAAAGICLGLGVGTTAQADTATTARAGGAVQPVVTRAGLDPALVAGAGADLGFVEQEAENAVTDGKVIGPDRSAYTLPAEASGRRAVTLEPGRYVEFTLPSAANAITVRYSIPDAPHGGGITAPLDVTAAPSGRGRERPSRRRGRPSR